MVRYFFCQNCRKRLCAPHDITDRAGTCPACGHPSGVERVLGAQAVAEVVSANAAWKDRLLSKHLGIPLTLAIIGVVVAFGAATHLRHTEKGARGFVVGFAWSAVEPELVPLHLGLVAMLGVFGAMLQARVMGSDFGPLWTVILKMAAIVSICFVIEVTGIAVASMPIVTNIPAKLLANRDLAPREIHNDVGVLLKMVMLLVLLVLVAAVMFGLMKWLFELEFLETVVVWLVLGAVIIGSDAVLCRFVPIAIQTTAQLTGECPGILFS